MQPSAPPLDNQGNMRQNLLQNQQVNYDNSILRITGQYYCRKLYFSPLAAVYYETENWNRNNLY